MTDNTKFSDQAMKDATALIKGLELSYLQQLETILSAEIKTRGDEDRRTAKAKILALAAANGIDLNSLVTSGAKVTQKRKDRVPTPAVYANPENPSETWSGRGRTPHWLKSQVDAGADIDTFRIVK